MQMKTRIKTRFFVVFVISFYCQINLTAAAPKIHHEDISLNLPYVESNAKVNYLTDDLQKIIGADSATNPEQVIAVISGKQLQAPVNKNIPSKSVLEVSTDIQIETETAIFVTGGATVFGLENIYNAKVVAVQDETKPKKFFKPSISGQITLALSKKEPKVKWAHGAKEKELQQKVDFSFSAAPFGSPDFKHQSKFFFTAVIPLFNPLQKSGIVGSNFEKAASVSQQVKKQKFDTSISFLQFSKLLDSFLRGPPTFS